MADEEEVVVAVDKQTGDSKQESKSNSKKESQEQVSKRQSIEPDGWRGSQIDSDSESEEEGPPPKRASRLPITRLSLTSRGGSGASAKRASNGSRVSKVDKRVSSSTSKDKDQRMSIATAPTVVHDGFWERLSRRVARIPRIFLATTLIISVILSVIVSSTPPSLFFLFLFFAMQRLSCEAPGMLVPRTLTHAHKHTHTHTRTQGFTVGGFDASVDNAGWQSRGTDIANKQTQLLLIRRHKDDMFQKGDAKWVDMINNVQVGWQSGRVDDDGEDNDDEFSGRKLREDEQDELAMHMARSHRDMQAAGLDLAQLLQRLVTGLPGCNIAWYNNATQLLGEEHLWPIWKTESSSSSLLSPGMLQQICTAEQNTLAVLEANKFCFGCGDGKCLPPYSPVLFARIVVENGFSMSCADLANGWAQYQADTETQWAKCSADLKLVYDANNAWTMPTSCPPGFSAVLVEDTFDSTKFMTYTSSVFPTNADPKVMYDFVDQFDQGEEDVVYGAYDTQYEGFK